MGLLTIPIVEKIIDVIGKVIPDPEAKARAQLAVMELQQKGEFKQIDADLQVMLAQAAINQEEAKSPDNFRGGWRPAVADHVDRNFCPAARAFRSLRPRPV